MRFQRNYLTKLTPYYMIKQMAKDLVAQTCNFSHKNLMCICVVSIVYECLGLLC